MNYHTPWSALVLSLALAPVVAHSQVIGSSAGGWTISGTDPIEVSFGGKMITAYHPGYGEGKPYFYPIIGPTGENMTRHWPIKEGTKVEGTDQVHHRGMWYGLGKVNGLDFWHCSGNETQGESAIGIIQHRGMTGVMIKGPTITFRTKSDWVEEMDRDHRICSDQREFTLFYREDGSLVIDLTLTLIADAGDVTITDSEEGAWAIHAPYSPALKGTSTTGQILNSDGMTGLEARGKRAAWVDFSGKDQAGNQVGIAILDHKSNFGHPTRWDVSDDGLFAADPFAKGDFDDEAPDQTGEHVIPNGETLKFRYRTIFHRGDPEAAGIEKAFELFSSK